MRAAAAFVVVAVALSGCSSSDEEVVARAETTAAPTTTPSSTAPSTDAPSTDTVRVEFRPVLQLVAPGEAVPEGAVPGQPDDTGAVAHYVLGPALLDDRAIESARAAEAEYGDHLWVVYPVLRPGADGIDIFNEAARLCVNADPVCPGLAASDTGGQVGQLAVVFDGVVISAPAINAAEFTRDQVQISGSFTKESAKELAAALQP